jgi:hypothetical protein
MNPSLIYPIILGLILLVPGNVLVSGQIADLQNQNATNTNMTTAATSSDNSTELIVVEEDKCSTKIGSAGMGFPREDRTECELEEWNDCKDLKEDLRAAGDGKTWGTRCDNVNELFMDDDC